MLRLCKIIKKKMGVGPNFSHNNGGISKIGGVILKRGHHSF